MPLARHDSIVNLGVCIFSISTHMPLARHDEMIYSISSSLGDFYSHASCEAWPGTAQQWYACQISTHMPLARHDRLFPYVFGPDYRFLLTCLLRGMTCHTDEQYKIDKNFYSHASCEAWLRKSCHVAIYFNFYSHASCEAWPKRHERSECAAYFYSHASCEAWLWRCRNYALCWKISTHMPLARHDNFLERPAFP